MEEIKAKTAVIHERVRRLSKLKGISFEYYPDSAIIAVVRQHDGVFGHSRQGLRPASEVNFAIHPSGESHAKFKTPQTRSCRPYNLRLTLLSLDLSII